MILPDPPDLRELPVCTAVQKDPSSPFQQEIKRLKGEPSITTNTKGGHQSREIVRHSIQAGDLLPSHFPTPRPWLRQHHHSTLKGHLLLSPNALTARPAHSARVGTGAPVLAAHGTTKGKKLS